MSDEEAFNIDDIMDVGGSNKMGQTVQSQT